MSTSTVINVDTLHWGFALEFSTLYLTDRFTPGKLPKDEPLNQLVPLVEFSFVSPRGEKTAATMNPGLSYVAVTWQVAAEAIVPLNSEARRDDIASFIRLLGAREQRQYGFVSNGRIIKRKRPWKKPVTRNAMRVG